MVKEKKLKGFSEYDIRKAQLEQIDVKETRLAVKAPFVRPFGWKPKAKKIKKNKLKE